MSFGMMHHVVWWKFTNISKVLTAFMIRLIEAVSTSEISVNFYQTTWHIIPEHSHLQTCHCKNLKSHQLSNTFLISCSPSAVGSWLQHSCEEMPVTLYCHFPLRQIPVFHPLRIFASLTLPSQSSDESHLDIEMRRNGPQYLLQAIWMACRYNNTDYRNSNMPLHQIVYKNVILC
jgi:hypothetical protein